MKKIFQDITAERERQDKKWGAARDLPNYTWLAILIEEVGEIAEGILKEIYWKDAREELVQIASVAVAWLENLDREHDQISDGWILVEDELPDGEDLVYGVWVNPKSGARFVAEAWINQNGQWVNDEAVLTSMGYYITHWQERQPLPTLPKEGEK